MPSRAEWRRWLEWTLRVALVAALAVALWRSVRATRPGTALMAVRASALGESLKQATASTRVGALNVQVDSSIDPARRAWLVALRRTGVDVRWHGMQPVLTLAVDRAREPVARARVRVIADSGTVVVSDSVGVIDSLQAAGGAALEASGIVGAVTIRRGSLAASATVPGRSERHDVLVLGRAGWESRFVIAALGEAGWRVRARLPVAPGAAVVHASLLPIDTARYDVVIALDSTAADLAGGIVRFVAQGGGAIVAGSALDVGALRALAPVRAGRRRAGRILLESDTLTRADLPLRPLVGLRPDALALERQPSGVAAAIRRAGRGRVAALGYDETWRWRMQGGDEGETAHRAWWSRMSGLVAPERAVSLTGAPSGDDPAPRAALVAALGPPSEESVAAGPPASDRLPLALLVLTLAALLAETASRRFRGES
jgi:hypothetical protein